LGEWATVLRGYSRLAAAGEDGLPRTVDQRMADDFLWAVGRCLDLADDRLGVLGWVARGRVAPVARPRGGPGGGARWYVPRRPGSGGVGNPGGQCRVALV